MPSTPQLLTSYLAEAAEAHISPFSVADHKPRLKPTPAPPPAATSEESTKEYISKIGILASSMPYYHDQYMEKRRANLRTDEGESLDPHDLGLVSNLSLDADPQEQSREEQAATARRLKPHSRSTVQLQSITASAAENVDVSSQVDKKKAKAIKWQFGIRSRNQPLDAMLCIYRALAAQGAQWQVPGDGSCHRRRSTGLSSQHQDEENDQDVDVNYLPDDYIPKDPWCIHVRWRKDGMYPAGIAQPSSAHSSRIDLNMDEQARRRSSIIGSLSSANGSTASVAGSYGVGVIDGACYVYMDVQLYMLEADCYLVDFKCAGYETIVETAISESEKMLVGSGFRVADKDVTSPQPFLDLTNKLVIYLANGA